MKQFNPNLKLTATNLGLALSVLGLATVLSGCASGLGSSSAATVTSPVAAGLHVTGTVFGGQQPVTGATIQLYTVGTTGLKSASTGLIASAITTDANGNFNLPAGSYTCNGTAPSTVAGTQVYLVATGGNPGNAGGAINANLSLVAALGSCATLLANAATTSVFINEVTTVAAAYALAPFTTDLTHIGATGSNPSGMVTAFSNAALLANTSNGTPGGANLATGVTVPSTEINTLANILASCVNSTGSATTACSTIFSATGATDTFTAATAIAKSPGNSSITALSMFSTPTAPFQPSSSAQPNDYTLAVTFAGATGTLASPYGVAIDASGNAFTTNVAGTTIAEFSPVGSLLGTSTATNLFGAQGIAIDRNANVWVANTAGNSVIKFATAAGLVTGSTSFTGNGITAPSSIALDSAGNAFIANFNGNSVTELNTSGANQNSSPFTGSSNNITNPSSIAVNKGGNVLVTSGLGYVVNLSNAGVYQSNSTDTVLQGPTSVAADPVSGASVVTGFTTGTAVAGAISEFTSTGVAASNSPVTTGLYTPSGVAADGVSYWVANSTTSGSLAQFTYGTATSTSPTSGFGSLNTPVGVAVDASGSVWTANSGSNSLTKFIGLATPVTTPIAFTAGP